MKEELEHLRFTNKVLLVSGIISGIVIGFLGAKILHEKNIVSFSIKDKVFIRELQQKNERCSERFKLIHSTQKQVSNLVYYCDYCRIPAKIEHCLKRHAPYKK